jgi:DNA repair protein RecO (recombination protein O)
VSTLDSIGESSASASVDAALGGAWYILAHMGFAPSLDECASCHASLAAESAAAFSHPAGGALCARCSSLANSRRLLPADARAAMRAWIAGEPASLGDALSRRAHQRLLREFLSEHLTDGRPLRAFDVWERNSWGAAVEVVP